jgi:hypothetical protein
MMAAAARDSLVAHLRILAAGSCASRKASAIDRGSLGEGSLTKRVHM